MATVSVPWSFSIVFTVLIFSSKLTEAQSVPAVFVFGDSLVDVGNNNYLPLSLAKANFPHNGVDFPNKKPTGRFSNGKNAADFLAEKVGLPTSPPYLSVAKKNASAVLTGVSFASGGAGIFNGSDDALRQSIPLTKQVGYYESVYKDLVQIQGPSAAQNRLSKSLFVFVIGSNDILGYSSDSKRTPQQHVDLMLLTLKPLVKRVYSSGARKFVFPGIGPIGCSPDQRLKNKTEECNALFNSMAVQYNEKLKSLVQELKAELTGMSYSYFDTYTVMQNMIQNPATYGFAEVKSACCGLGKLNSRTPCLPIATYCSNRRDHLFWDPYHPTQAAASILVDALYDGTSQYTFPINVRQLVTV